MQHHYMFLDEAKPNTNFRYFCLAGCCIEANHYQQVVIPQVESLKHRTLGSSSIILHESDIRRHNSPFQALSDLSKERVFWSDMNQLFTSIDLKVFGVVIQVDDYQRLYPSDNASDLYFIALQLILENFVHYLEIANGRGSLYVESRNPSEDLRLQNHYHTLVANGTLFLTRNAMQKRLTTISFPIKSDNNIGLQLADFIPNPLVRECSSTMNQRPMNLITPIISKRYDGFIGLPERFGVKCVP